MKKTKMVNILAASFLFRSDLLHFLQVTWTIIKSRMSLIFGQIRPWTAALSCPCASEKKTHILKMGYIMNILEHFLIGTSLFLQETRTCIKALMSSNSNHIRPLTTELHAIERLKNQCKMFFVTSVFIITKTCPCNILQFFMAVKK